MLNLPNALPRIKLLGRAACLGADGVLLFLTFLKILSGVMNLIMLPTCVWKRAPGDCTDSSPDQCVVAEDYDQGAVAPCMPDCVEIWSAAELVRYDVSGVCLCCWEWRFFLRGPRVMLGIPVFGAS